MVAQSVQNASTLQLRRIRHYFVIIVFTYFLINVFFIEFLALFAFNEQQIQKINKTLLEFLQKIDFYYFLLMADLVKCPEEISFADPSYHLCL